MYLNLNICTVFLKNRKFISKIRISKVTDYAALNVILLTCVPSRLNNFSGTCKYNTIALSKSYDDIGPSQY